MLATILTLTVAISVGLPGFVPPSGWVAKPPPNSGPNFIWLSPRFGHNGNGENVALTIHPVSSGTTVAAEAQKAIDELSEDRTIVNSHPEPTCGGRMPGWTFEGRIVIPNGPTVAQLYPFTVENGKAYMFVLTRRAGDPIDPAITRSIQTICPKKTMS